MIPNDSATYDNKIKLQYFLQYNGVTYDSLDESTQQTIFKLYDSGIKMPLLYYLKLNSPPEIKRIALNDIKNKIPLLTKSNAIKKYTKEFVDSIDWYVPIRNTHNNKLPASLYFTGVLEMCWKQYNQKNIKMKNTEMNQNNVCLTEIIPVLLDLKLPYIVCPYDGVQASHEVGPDYIVVENSNSSIMTTVGIMSKRKKLYYNIEISYYEYNEIQDDYNMVECKHWETKDISEITKILKQCNRCNTPEDIQKL